MLRTTRQPLARALAKAPRPLAFSQQRRSVVDTPRGDTAAEQNRLELSRDISSVRERFSADEQIINGLRKENDRFNTETVIEALQQELMQLQNQRDEQVAKAARLEMQETAIRAYIKGLQSPEEPKLALSEASWVELETLNKWYERVIRGRKNLSKLLIMVVGSGGVCGFVVGYEYKQRHLVKDGESHSTQRELPASSSTAVLYAKLT